MLPLRTPLLLAVLSIAIGARSGNICHLPDGTTIMADDKDDVPYLAQWTSGAWEAIALPAGLAPAKGGFEAICADPAGNLYLSFTDETEEGKKTCGVLARVGGTWSRLGAFEKNWEAGDHLAATGPTDVYLTAFLIKERGKALLHWDGKTYAVLSAPEGTEEMNGLVMHADKPALLAYGRGPSGTYRDGTSTFRIAGAGWERMGEPATGSADILLATADGALYRLGRVAEKWDGSAWEEAFSFENSSLDGYHIEEACLGAKGELYLVLEDADYKSHLACWPGTGKLQWLKGDESAAKFKYGLHDLFVDRDGALMLNSAGEMRRFVYADFDYAPDGYPAKDEKAGELFDLFNAVVAERGPIQDQLDDATTRFLEAKPKNDPNAQSLQALGISNPRTTAVDSTKFHEAFKVLKAKTGTALDWYDKAIGRMKALGIGEKRNRLYDPFLSSLIAGKDQVYYGWVMHQNIHAGGDPLAGNAKLMDANHRQVAAVTEMEEAVKGYARRNGIMK